MPSASPYSGAGRTPRRTEASTTGKGPAKNEMRRLEGARARRLARAAVRAGRTEALEAEIGELKDTFRHILVHKYHHS